MASYSTINTIPAADVSETPLLSRDIKVNAKTLLGGAAAAAFVLGAAAATVVAPAAPSAPAAFAAAPISEAPASAAGTTIRFATQNGEAFCLTAVDDALKYSVCSDDANQQFLFEDGTIKSLDTDSCIVGPTGTETTGLPGSNTYESYAFGDCSDAALFKRTSTNGPFQMETSGKCLLPITGPLEWGDISDVGFDVVGGSCETRRKYTWWTEGEQPYDNVWHTAGGI